jgi:hypothetical protein
MIVLEWPWTLHAHVTITIPVSKVQSFPNGIKRVGGELAKPINTKQTAHVTVHFYEKSILPWTFPKRHQIDNMLDDFLK